MAKGLKKKSGKAARLRGPAKAKASPPKPALKKPGVSWLALHLETGADRHSIKKWCQLEGIDPAVDPQAARDCIARHRMPQRKPLEHSGGPPVLAKSGLPWQMEKMRQESLKLERENLLADKLALKEYMPTAVYFQILRELFDKLNQAPGKIASKLGLGEAPKAMIVKVLDEIREDASTAIGGMKFEAVKTEELTTDKTG